MHHFFVEETDIVGEVVYITGENYRHLKTVLRAELGEHVLISDGSGTDYECEVTEITGTEVLLKICFREEIHELPAEIYLFQGLPKSDKLELIIQKAVELGAYEIVPLKTKNTVVKLEEKKVASKVTRWQAIAEAAAKQSKRSIIPTVAAPMSWREAMQYVADFDVKLIPYENARGIQATVDLLRAVAEGRNQKIAVFIGPEGGFSEAEIQDALAAGIQPVSLGRRILRTETAAITALSLLMTALEIRMDGDSTQEAVIPSSNTI